MLQKLRPLLRNFLRPGDWCRRMLSTTNVQILSGIQPTGNIHLGNYFGAIKQWVEYQNGPNADLANLLQSGDKIANNMKYLPPVFQIVDMHSITTWQEPDKLRHNIFEIVAVLLGCGIDPQKCILFKQSSLPYVGYLCWILSCISTMSQLSRFPQFKVCITVMSTLYYVTCTHQIKLTIQILL